MGTIISGAIGEDGDDGGDDNDKNKGHKDSNLIEKAPITMGDGNYKGNDGKDGDKIATFMSDT